jgi:hypothetical protein
MIISAIHVDTAVEVCATQLRTCMWHNEGLCVGAGDLCPSAHGEIEKQLHPLSFQSEVCFIRRCKGLLDGCCNAHNLYELHDTRFEPGPCDDVKAKAEQLQVLPNHCLFVALNESRALSLDHTHSDLSVTIGTPVQARIWQDLHRPRIIITFVQSKVQSKNLCAMATSFVCPFLWRHGDEGYSAYYIRSTQEAYP